MIVHLNDSLVTARGTRVLHSTFDSARLHIGYIRLAHLSSRFLAIVL